MSTLMDRMQEIVNISTSNDGCFSVQVENVATLESMRFEKLAESELRFAMTLRGDGGQQLGPKKAEFEKTL